MITMTISQNKELPDYLITIEIIKSLIDYLLIDRLKHNISDISNFDSNKNNYHTSGYFKNHLELIKLSLVSKKWYNTCSKLISNYIINNDIIQEWFCPKSSDYNYIKYIEKTRYKYFSEYISFKLPINNEFSIIKISNLDVVNYFSQVLLLDPVQVDQITTTSHKKVIINDDILMVKQLVGVNNDNIEINIIEESCDPIIMELSQNSSGGTNNIIKLNKFQLTNVNDNKTIDDFQLIFNKFQCKHFVLSTTVGNYIHPKNDNHMDYSKSLFSNHQFSLQSLEIVTNDHIEPNSLHNINLQCPNLKSLSIPILFHYLIKAFKCVDKYPQSLQDQININIESCKRGETPNKKFKYCDNKICTLKSDWMKMVKELSENKTIKSLTLSNYCPSAFGCIEIEFSDFGHFKSIVDQGLCQLFKDNSTVTHLRCVNMEILCSISLAGLKFNQTIVTIELVFKTLFSLALTSFNTPPSKDIWSFLFENVFNCNQSAIRNLIADYNDYSITTFILQSLSNKTTTCNLYSITLPFKIDQNLNELINLLQNDTLDNLVEINLKLKDLQDRSTKLQSIKTIIDQTTIVNKNNKIINIIC